MATPEINPYPPEPYNPLRLVETQSDSLPESLPKESEPIMYAVVDKLGHITLTTAEYLDEVEAQNERLVEPGSHPLPIRVRSPGIRLNSDLV